MIKKYIYKISRLNLTLIQYESNTHAPSIYYSNKREFAAAIGRKTLAKLNKDLRVYTIAKLLVWGELQCAHIRESRENYLDESLGKTILQRERETLAESCNRE